MREGKNEHLTQWITLYARAAPQYDSHPSRIIRWLLLMRKSLPLVLIMLCFAAAPGCCVLELHPFPWMAAARPPRQAPIDDHPEVPLVNVAQSPTAAPAS